MCDEFVCDIYDVNGYYIGEWKMGYKDGQYIKLAEFYKSPKSGNTSNTTEKRDRYSGTP